MIELVVVVIFSCLILSFIPLQRLSKADLEARDHRGINAIDWAAQYGNLPMLKILLANGVDINLTQEGKKASKMWTPLYHAVNEGHVDVVEFLIRQKDIKWGGEKKGIFSLLYLVCQEKAKKG